MKHHIGRLACGTAILAAIAVAGCGRKQTMASKTAAAYDEAKKKGIPIEAGEHGGLSTEPASAATKAMKPAATPGMDHGTMPGMDQSQMRGMNHSQMPSMKHDSSGAGMHDVAGMDHSAMAGMDHSRTQARKPGSSGAGMHDMAGMDHSAMPGMDHSKMPGMQHGSATAEAHDMAGMNHSAMPGMEHGSMPGMQGMQHGSQTTAPIAIPPPASNAAIAHTQPAAALRPDHLDAPPPTALDPLIGELLQAGAAADKRGAVALTTNPRLQATLAELGIARADLLQASVVRNPLFEAEIRFPSDPFRPFELRLAQTLVDLIQLPRRRALGRAAFDEAKLRVTSEVVRFAADVRARHSDLPAASQRVPLSRLNLEAAKATAELAQRQHDAQNITDLDLENEQAQYEGAKLDAAREEQALLLAREALLRGMGLRDASLDWQL